MDFTEKTINKNYVFNGKIINVRRDDALLPDGRPCIREIVEHPGGVCVAPVTPEGNLIFVRQYRYAFSEMLVELPAGKLEKGEDPFEAGKRELEEETGYVAENFIDCGKMYATPGYCSEIIHLYAAFNMHKTQVNPDDDEFLEVFEIPVDKAVRMVMDNEIRDGKTQVLVLKVAALMEKGLIK